MDEFVYSSRLLFSITCRWYRYQLGRLRNVTQMHRVTPSEDILHIRKLSQEDAGRWVCKVGNEFGTIQLETQLNVTAKLGVHVQPKLQVELLF
jgi:hypothetical protein